MKKGKVSKCWDEIYSQFNTYVQANMTTEHSYHETSLRKWIRQQRNISKK